MATPSSLPLTLVDWLDDLCVRFLLNLPSSELSSVPRLCFQVEEAQWYYEDFVRPAVAGTPGAAPLPSLPLRQFCLLLFQHCPLLSGFTDAQHIAAYEEFLAYKVRVPVRGAILMDESMSKVVLVRGWKKGSSWSFPRGKINKDERDLDCAIREVYEETGYDIASSGLLPEGYNYEDQVGEENKVKYIDMTMREQHIRLFVLRGVPLDTHFETKTRKEISKIAWYDIKDLPGFAKQKNQKHPQQVQQSEADTAQASKFYMVAPFLGPLKKWIHQQRKNDVLEAKQNKARYSTEFATATEDDTEDQTPERDVVDDSTFGKEEALKKLFSIDGGPSPAPVTNTSAPSATTSNANASNLLAMLQGSAPPSGRQSSNGGHLPRTPFDQIITSPPQQPEAPHPHDPRQPSVGQFQQQHPGNFNGPPQFPFSPQAVQSSQQRNLPLPTPNVFGQPQFPPNQGPPFQHPGMPPIPPQHQQHFPPRPNMQGPPYPSAPYPSGPQNQFPFPHPPGVQSQSHMQPPAHLPPPPFQGAPPQSAQFIAPQGPGAIGSGPSAPNASQLPPPRLNAHTASLLDAFRGGPPNANNRDNRLASPPAGQTGSVQRPSSSHQNALLDLFKKPSPTPLEPQIQAETAAPEEPPLSPALTDVTEKPPRPRVEERRPTLNEITRTLGPIKTKSKSKKASATQSTAAPLEPSVAPAQVVVQEPPMEKQLFDPHEGVMKPVTPTTRDSRAEGTTKDRPKSRQLFDPRESSATKPAPSNAKVEGQDSSSPVRKILQRPSSKQGSRSPQFSRQSLAPASSSPARDGATSQNSGGGSRPSSFTILTRPGSSRGPKSPVPPVTPTSPAVRSDQMDTPKATFQPQVLKRPMDSEAVQGDKRQGKNDEGSTQQLLALFGKTAAGATSKTPPTQRQAQASSNAAVLEHNNQQENIDTETAGNKNANALLNLFKSNNGDGSNGSTLMPSRSPDPPPAPKLSPVARKVSPVPTMATQAQAPTPPVKTPQPNAMPPPQKSQQNLLLDLFQNRPANPTPASALATNNTNVASPGTPISPFTLGTPATNASAASFSSMGSRLASPTESSPVDDGKDKEFLMGYLNGIVRSESFKGAGWR